MSLAYINWDPDPTLFDLGFLQVRYYSICFMLAFVASYVVVQKQFIKNQIALPLLDSLTMYVFFGTLLGARIGHCLFYDFEYFSRHPWEILLPFTFSPSFHFTGFTGLASHGGGAGIIISLVLFAIKYKINLWFLLDNIALVVPLAGFFIRLGNLMNSEIIGRPTDVNWAFVFLKEDMLPRHPAQLYEAIAYLLIFVVVYKLINKWPRPKGFYFGLVILLIFIFRFAIEFLKEHQVAFESGLVLDMGQLLSIPFLLTGLIVMFFRYKKKEIKK